MPKFGVEYGDFQPLETMKPYNELITSLLIFGSLKMHTNVIADSEII